MLNSPANISRYNNLPYIQKREVLRDFFNNDKNTYTIIKKLSESINENLDIKTYYIDKN